MEEGVQVPGDAARAAEARRQHVATVTGVVIAGVLASFVVPGPYSWGSTLIGLVLAALLYGYGEEPYDMREAVGFSAALAFVLLLTTGIAFDEFLDISDWSNSNADQHHSDGLGSALVWLGFFVASLLVSRQRLPDERRRLRRNRDSPASSTTGTGAE